MTKTIKPVSSYFGENLFSLERMERMLPANVYKKILAVVHKNEKLDLKTADIVASAMKDWAIGRGCTHYSHWFQPLTGYTAEKHDSFISKTSDGKVIESFSGRQLIQGEPDASSFPSGGIRSTFEARGYSIWDPTSPAFIIEYPDGNTLCIPSIFISYTGETLDKKAPLLRSIQALNTSALNILKLFNNPASRVFSTLGVEQEYFLIDREYYKARPDLRQTGRTLFGLAPAKHQQLEDQYFGNIPERAFAFMTEIETESYKLGIPLKTRHNEVAPNQFEVAPVFEDVNVAADHNQILMDLMDRVAQHHGLAVLLHEKPFAHINGSGKHCNWSMATDSGENLLNPGRTPRENLQFLVFLVSTIKAVATNAKLLRAAIASAANDHRLGANEAPPAIISVFLGETLTRVLDDIVAGTTTETTDEAWMSAGIDKIPEILKDNTDRNRTSPFAFTGNKFEFRAVGSSQTPSTSITVLNTALAAQLQETCVAVSRKIGAGKEFNTAIVDVLRDMISSSRQILFEGDNYSDSWAKEAKRRGLPNINNTPESLQVMKTNQARELFSNYKVYSEREFESLYHIDMEHYIKQVDIEASVIRDMASTMYLPAAIRYLKDLTDTITGVKATLGAANSALKPIKALVQDISTRIGKLQTEIGRLDKDINGAHAKPDIDAKGLAFVAVRNQGEKIREAVDGLESIVPRTYWPVPQYSDMLIGL